MVSEDILPRARNAFKQALFEVMEKMYFVFLEPVSEEGLEEGLHAVEVGFSGPWEGKITVYFSPDLLFFMINNVLGLEEREIDDKVRIDTAKECTNMVAGSFLRKFEPEKAIHLSIPEYLGVQHLKKLQGEFTLTMEAERGRISAAVSFYRAT